MRLYTDKAGNGKGAAFTRQVLLLDQLNGVGVSDEALVKGLFNVQVWGTFVATLYLERSLDNGTTWHRLTAWGTQNPITGPISESLDEPEVGARYRFNCTSHTSGIAFVRISK